MNLDSCRAFKQELTSDLEGRIARRRGRGNRPFGLDVSTIDRVEPFPRAAAIGVAPGRTEDDYYLAIRLQTHGMENHPVVQSALEQAGDEVDVRYIGRVTKQQAPWHQTRQRPLRIGCSIGHYRITAGTLGGFVSGESGETLILSNNHVLANENDASEGDAILQPGDADGGSEQDRVAALAAFVPLEATSINHVDCAVARIDEGIDDAGLELADAGELGSEVADVGFGQVVEKIGRTTGHTHGRVTAFEVDNVIINYDIGEVRFDGQIEIESAGEGPFSAGGDSGSVIFDSVSRNPVALLFAGSEVGGSNGRGLTFATPIEVALDALHVSLLSG